jgi:Reverse transcriptase (RNA-dependent DNA polymerase)
VSVNVLEPSIELMRQEYVLVQAWKKTASYIRHHNWFADTLELDRTAVNLPRFLAELGDQLKTPDDWRNEPLRIVPAPKSQQWRVVPDTTRWEPRKVGKTAAKLRPLAHASLKDQVAASALMLCLADRVETIQGDPRDPMADAATRRRVISYGNRLFCDVRGQELRHRWGSGKLYRAYYQDYRSFLSRPEVVAEALDAGSGAQILIIQSDLSQFYDRVRPPLLHERIDALKSPDDDPQFYALARRLLNWEWDKRDSREVESYAKQANISEFSRVALPQGLVASGFLANVTLLGFDQGLRESLSQDIEPGIRLEDACRYVDDIRIVLSVDPERSLPDIEKVVINFLTQLLERHANGLQVAEDKTIAAVFGGDERPLVRQSRKMARIQAAVSGGFDAIGGVEILDAIQGLIRSQQRYSKERTEQQGGPFLPVPDVGDATVARFAAGRFRSTYRSLRPLLADQEGAPVSDEEKVGHRPIRTRAELDDEVRAFALGLIENWVEDPSNVRLLRIGLDLWPAEDLLRSILQLLRPFTQSGGRRKAPRRVAWYCLSEIYRAGATETGFVEDEESLPDRIDIRRYRSVLQEEAARLVSLPTPTLPWYLKQQVLLFLAVNDPTHAPILRTGRNPETRHYRELIRFLNGEDNDLTGADYATLAILSRRSFLGREMATQLVSRGITVRRLEEIAERDPSFGLEILASRRDLGEEISPRLRDDLCIERNVKAGGSDGWAPLSQVVLDNETNGPLRNEITLLEFASKFLVEWQRSSSIEVIAPVNVRVKLQSADSGIPHVEALDIVPSRATPSGSMYHPPYWCATPERWRFQLGYLLRFILSAQPDFTKVVRPYYRKERNESYRASVSHWYQRLYGLFNGHSAFGDDWLPISEWTEQLLFALLNWPGCRSSDALEWIRAGIETTRTNVDARSKVLSEMQGPLTDVLMLPLSAPRPSKPSPRPLRACIVQTVIPGPADFDSGDLTLSGPTVRKQHRNHLSVALKAIEGMLDLRETHKGRDGRLDWLILPELSVHPRDVGTHLVPFARAHKTIILAGLTYQALFANKPLINSAVWVIPIWSPTHGLQVLTRRQGKQHLAPEEQKLNASGTVVQGFRPCQWLVGYEWSGSGRDRPLRLTASICYDATDLNLAASLRQLSDVFAIPSLNRDVNTFDQMALALHYHMFQMVIVANNGEYGGSNAYVPYAETYRRQAFHLHGQPQATLAFVEIEDIPDFIARKANAMAQTPAAPNRVGWKYPPAGV